MPPGQRVAGSGVWKTLGKHVILLSMKTNNSNKKTISLSLRLQRLILSIIFVVTVTFLVSVYLITAKERQNYVTRE